MQSNSPGPGPISSVLRPRLTLLGIAIVIGIAAMAIALNLPVTDAPGTASQQGSSEGIHPSDKTSEFSATTNPRRGTFEAEREPAPNSAPASSSLVEARAQMDGTAASVRPVTAIQSAPEVQPGAAASELRTSAVIEAEAAESTGPFNGRNGQSIRLSIGVGVGQKNSQSDSSTGGQTSPVADNSGGNAAPDSPVAADFPVGRSAPSTAQPGGSPSDTPQYEYLPDENYRAIYGNDAYNAAINNAVKSGSPTGQ